jgi:ribosomal protein L11 methylase PrmA
MSGWLLAFILLAGGLFCLKMIYVLCVTWVLPRTQGALFVTTSRTRISAVLENVPMTPDQLFMDLGCGDGRVLRAVRKRHGVQTIGYELNPLAYIMAKLLCRETTIKRKDFFEQNLSKADVVFCYLFPDVMKRLAAKLKSELKPGTTVISCNFPLPGFSYQKLLKPKGVLHSDPIYVYVL